MNKIKKIGILTSGGDCGGLNAAIRSIFFRAKTITKSFEIFNQLQVLELSKFSQFFSENSFPIILIIFFLFTHRWDNWQNLKEIAKNLTPRIFIPLVLILWLIIISFASSSSGAFIYFDF